jgi:hypothetical protein
VAFLAGVPTGKMKITAFAVAGLLVGVGAWSDRRRKSVLRTELLLPAYAAAFLSITTYRPGYYNVPGIVVAIILLAVGFNGLNLLGAPFWPSRSSMAPCSSLRSSPPGRTPQKLNGAQASLPRARWNRHSASFRCGWLKHDGARLYHNSGRHPMGANLECRQTRHARRKIDNRAGGR